MSSFTHPGFILTIHYIFTFICRKTIEEEIETLHRDIRFLYDCLDEEADYRAESEGTITREPTISGRT